ncbi:unnamed protein product [Choristocarpus tenellus]
MDEEELSKTLEDHGTAFNGFAENVQAEVFNMISSQSVGPQGFVENVQAFRHAVDWSETWIQGLLTFHLFLLIFFIITRNNFNIQVGLFLVVLALGRASELLNTYLAGRWKDFARQNYFDPNGVFMGIMWASPLLFVGFLQLLNFLRQCASMLVIVKREAIKRELAAKKKNKEGKVKGKGNAEQATSTEESASVSKKED